jgi:hypothetical protein
MIATLYVRFMISRLNTRKSRDLEGSADIEILKFRSRKLPKSRIPYSLPFMHMKIKSHYLSEQKMYGNTLF